MFAFVLHCVAIIIHVGVDHPLDRRLTTSSIAIAGARADIVETTTASAVAHV